MRFKVSISYDGTNFNGSQKQPTYRSVEGEVEKALESMHKKKVKATFCSRTDKGVHALNQVFHFDTDLRITPNGVKRGLNGLLPSDIHVNEVEEVSEKFHSRFSAKGKTYKYLINENEYDPLTVNYVYQLGRKLDIEKMKEASKLFVGEHNFYNFCGYQEEKIKDYVRTIESIEIIKDNKNVEIIIKGNGFIRYMVRMIVAILIEIGLSRKDNSFILERLDVDEKKRSNYKVTGSGLYLVKIEY